MFGESEKKNLEMHVELESLRDEDTKKTINELDEKLENVLETCQDLYKRLNKIEADRYKDSMKIGGYIIWALLTALGMLLFKLLSPLFLGK